jgi:uncharacterized membrane protein
MKIAMLKNLIMKPEGGISWSKAWAWITTILGAIVLLYAQIVAAGVTIPAELLPVFKFAAIISGLITAIRVRNASSPAPTLPAAMPPAEPAKDGK